MICVCIYRSSVVLRLFYIIKIRLRKRNIHVIRKLVTMKKYVCKSYIIAMKSIIATLYTWYIVKVATIYSSHISNSWI